MVTVYWYMTNKLCGMPTVFKEINNSSFYCLSFHSLIIP